MNETEASTEVHLLVAPRDGEVVVTKRRVSAFAGSDLDAVLRSLDVDSLVLTGIATAVSSCRRCGRRRTWTSG